MLQHGVAVNGRNQWGFTPLHWAASEGHKEVRPRSPESSARKPMSQTARPKFLPLARSLPAGVSAPLGRASLGCKQTRQAPNWACIHQFLRSQLMACARRCAGIPRE